MFGWGIHTVTEGQTLMLYVPSHWLAALLSIPVVMSMLGGSVMTRHKLILRLILGCLGYGLLLQSSVTSFNKSTNIVTVRQFWFWHWMTQQFPLDTVDSMFVRSGDTVSQLCLQRTDGSVISLSLRDQNINPGSKDGAAYQVNKWLGGAATPAGKS